METALFLSGVLLGSSFTFFLMRTYQNHLNQMVSISTKTLSVEDVVTQCKELVNQQISLLDKLLKETKDEERNES